MIPTFVMAAALAVGAHDPVPPPAEPVPEIHKVPGPAFLIPCKVQAADAVALVQLWVSADRGKKWELYEEITPAKPAFTFIAKKAGEYWFAPRIKKKDGTLLPAETADLVVTQRVAVATGSDSPDIAVKPSVPTAAETVAELDEELTRVELELIRKEIKKLSEAKELTQEAEDKFDRLRVRLRDLRDRLRPDRDRVGPSTLMPLLPNERPRPPVLFPEEITPAVRPSAPDDGPIPPAAVPTDPLIVAPAPKRVVPPAQLLPEGPPVPPRRVTPEPALPAAPPPRAREQR